LFRIAPVFPAKNSLLFPAGVYFLALYRKGNRMPEMVGSCTAALFQK
jgi:hypothetical protein